MTQSHTAALRALLDAWNTLPKGEHYPGTKVGTWLTERMQPAIDNARAALASPADERAAFENWIQEIYMDDAPLAWTDERNCYDDFAVHCAWSAWKARAGDPND